MDNIQVNSERTVWDMWPKIFDYFFHPFFFGEKKDDFDYGLYEPLPRERRRFF